MVEATSTNPSEEEVKALQGSPANQESAVAGDAGEVAKKKKKRNKKKKGAAAAQGDDLELDALEEEKTKSQAEVGDLNEESKVQADAEPQKKKKKNKKKKGVDNFGQRE